MLRKSVVTFLILGGFVACGDNTGVTTLFEVKVENISGASTAGYPIAFGSVAWALSSLNGPIFTAGQTAADNGLEAAAEDANLQKLLDTLQITDGVNLIGLAQTPTDSTEGGALLSGKTFRFVISSQQSSRLFFISTFLQGNDLFIGTPDTGIELFDADGRAITADITNQLTLFDAGTEVNETPGSGPNQVVRQTGENAGALESKAVGPVNDGFSYPGVGAMLRVTIAPIGETQQ